MQVPKVSSSFLHRFVHLYRVSANPIAFFDHCIDHFGHFFHVQYPAFDFHYLLAPEGVQYVLEKNHDNFQKSTVYDPLKLAIGNGLLTSDGDFWKQQRKIIQPLFNTSFIKSFCHDISLATDRSLQHMGADPFNLTQALADLTIDIACRAFFDVEDMDFSAFISEKTNEINEFVAQRVLFPFVPMWFPLPSHRRFNRSMIAVNEHVKKLIVKSTQMSRKPALLSMLAHSTSMTDEQVRDEVLTFLVAGHETTTNAIGFLLYLLSKYPDVKATVKEEIDAIVTEEHPSYETIQKLTYTKAVINEALRLFPPAWLISRESLNDDTINGYDLPKASTINIPIYLIHRQPDFWEQPNAFHPDHFLTKHDRHKFSFLPFGGGPRFCIGMQFAYTEILIFLCKLFRYSDFKVLNTNIELDFFITLKSKTPIQCQLIH